MSKIEYTSSERAYTTEEQFPPCCGLAPMVLRWHRHKGLISVVCRNPEYANHIGVLEGDSGIYQKWARFRVVKAE